MLTQIHILFLCIWLRFSKVKPLLHVCPREVKEWIMEAAQGTQDINGCPYDGRYDEWVP